VIHQARYRIAHLHTKGRCALLALLLAGALLAALHLAYSLAGVLGGLAAIAAATVVLIASIGGLLIAEMFRSPAEAIWGMLFSMGLRMSLPMAACFVVLLCGGALSSGGFVYFVLAFYLLALPMETLLAVSQIGEKPNA
jgi:hypothetical protein